jgi:hypothetical protein
MAAPGEAEATPLAEFPSDVPDGTADASPPLGELPPHRASEAISAKASH